MTQTHADREVEAPQLIDFALLGLMSASMATTFMFTKWALTELSAWEVGAGRLLLSGLVLVPLAYLVGQPLRREVWFWGWAALLGGLSFTLPFFLLAWGQQFVPTNLAGTYFAAMPLLTLALSGLVLRVRITRRKALGLGIGAVGLVVLANPFAASGVGGSLLPDLAIIGAILSFAFAAIALRLAPRVEPIALIAGAALVGAVSALPVLALTWAGPLPQGRALVGLVGTAVISTAMAHSLRFVLIRRRGPVFLAPNAYLSTLLVLAIAVFFLGEALSASILIAFPLIVVGLWVAGDGSGIMRRL